MEKAFLSPTDGRKSFYGKAYVTTTQCANGVVETLYSYDTPIIKRINGTLIPVYAGDKYGNTTARHVKAFCGINKAEYMRLLKARKNPL